MEVYIVGNEGPEHNIIHSVHKTYKGALKAWNKIRLQLLGCAKSYFHDTPYIRKYDVKE
jgi:hypothetical protein